VFQRLIRPIKPGRSAILSRVPTAIATIPIPTMDLATTHTTGDTTTTSAPAAAVESSAVTLPLIPTTGTTPEATTLMSTSCTTCVPICHCAHMVATTMVATTIIRSCGPGWSKNDNE
jgi:hypothetical protein